MKPCRPAALEHPQDFSEFETSGQGIWNLGGIVDYRAELALGCRCRSPRPGRDGINMLEQARDIVGELLGRPLIEDCTDPDTGVWPW